MRQCTVRQLADIMCRGVPAEPRRTPRRGCLGRAHALMGAAESEKKGRAPRRRRAEVKSELVMANRRPEADVPQSKGTIGCERYALTPPTDKLSKPPIRVP